MNQIVQQILFSLRLKLRMLDRISCQVLQDTLTNLLVSFVEELFCLDGSFLFFFCHKGIFINHEAVNRIKEFNLLAGELAAEFCHCCDDGQLQAIVFVHI
jgi:hypothetical protein